MENLSISDDRKIIAKALSGKFKRGQGDPHNVKVFIKALLFNGKISHENADLLERLILNGQY